MKSTIAIFLVLLGLVLYGCKKKDTPSEPETARTVLVYIIANNNLSSYGFEDINEMESAWKDSYSGNLIVFYNDQTGKNRLFKISRDDDMNNINSEVVKWYPKDSKVCTKEFLQEVISDVQDLFPADSYALDLWSHGSGWLPHGQYDPLTISAGADSKYFTGIKPTFSTFGQDNENFGYFESYDLADALSPYKFDFLLFDACHMASIECEYQMKNCCSYYIASVAETLVDGAPYDQIVSDMFEQPQANVISIAEKFYNYYKNSSCTISVIDCSKLDKVAEEVSKVVTKNPNVPISSIQQYGRDNTGFINCMYDLEDFVQKTWGTEETSAVSNALSDAVIYKAATPYLFSGEIAIKHHCGLSCYIPQSKQKNCLNIFRNHYSWSSVSGLGSMVD